MLLKSGSRGRSTLGVLCCLLVNSTPKVWEDVRCPVDGCSVTRHAQWTVILEFPLNSACLVPMTGDRMVGARWLVDWKSLSRHLPGGRWLSGCWCPVTWHTWWLVTRHARPAGCVFFSIGRLAGGQWAGRGKPGDHCPVACGWCTPLGTSTQGVATNMGLSLASTAMWGSAPMFICPLFWGNRRILRLLPRRHSFLSGC